MHDLDADYYRNYSSRQYMGSIEVIKEISLKGEETCLDIGCGDGRITAEISKRLPHGSILGIDLSPSMIQLAQASFPKEDYSNLTFTLGNIEEVSFPSSFDCITMFHVMHWVRNPWKAIRNIASSLKKGGELNLLLGPKESPTWGYLEKGMEAPEWQPYKEKTPFQSVLYSHEYTELLKEVGLEVERCFLEKRLMYYRSIKEWVEYVRGWIGCYLPLESSLRESFLITLSNCIGNFSLTPPELGLNLRFMSLTYKCRKI